MDAVSYAHSAKQAQRIKKFVENPDSVSGVLTQPSVIQAGETVTVPTGRTAILANTQIDGTLTVDGTVFIPSGATTTDIDTKLSTKVNKVTSTDNAIVRFNGTTGDVQNSKVFIDDSGNIGMGVTPSAWYYGKHIQTLYSAFGENYAGHADIQSNSYEYSNNAYKYILNGVGASRYTANLGNHTWFVAPSGTADNPITWNTAMSLNSLGNLLLPGSETQNAYVECQGGSASNSTFIQAANISGTDAVFHCRISNVVKAQILANGTYQSATNVYGSTSDIKLKEKVVDATPKLDKLMKVKVRNFNYIGQEDKQIGVIAQEIEQIFPSIVFETKDTKQVEVIKERVVPAVEEVTDEEGNVITEAKPESIEEHTEIETQETGEVTKNVKYSVLSMIAIKALQELNAKVETMQLEINELKGAK